MTLRKREYRDEIEYYLKRGNLTAIERLIERLQDEGILIDLTEIRNIEQIISQLILQHLVPNYNIEEVFRVLQFANDFQFFEHSTIKPIFSIPNHERELIFTNLQSLFGPLSNGFFDFIVYHLADSLREIIENPDFLTNSMYVQITDTIPLSRKIQFLYYLIDNYTFYGLRSRKIGTFNQYLNRYKKYREKFDENYYTFEIEKSETPGADSIPSGYFFFFQPATEKHLIYAPLLEQVKQKYEHQEYQYEFPIISMVVYGGLGPEGKGFTYLSPSTDE
ncbi:MAG: hypothetical protein ACFFD2_30690, partial [Promethearchaeota archaeon]